MGSDIGGSIRAPAAFCGTYGLRTTALRNPLHGLKTGEGGQESIRPVIGPLASQSIEDLELFQQVVIDQEPWELETSLVPLPWRRVTPTRNMTVGIMWDDGCVHLISPVKESTDHCRCVRPHPPIIRALKYAKEKLMAAGIKVVDWEPYKHDHGWEIVVRTTPSTHI